MMYEGEDLNTIDLLYEVATEKRNGVRVIVPLKGNDYYSFKMKIAEQLAYFETVYFDVDGMLNDHIIFRSEHYQYSQLVDTGLLHLSLDNVYYPIDFNKLGISDIYFPVALRFSLSDGIYPTPNRESVRYNSEVKQIILDKIRMIADQLVDEYNVSGTEIEGYLEFLTALENNKKYITIAENIFEITAIEEHASKPTLPISLKGVKHLDPVRLSKKDHIFDDYAMKAILTRGVWKELPTHRQTPTMHNLRQSKYIFCKDYITNKQKIYLKEYVSNKGIKYATYPTLKKVSNLPLFSKNRSCYYDILSLSHVPRQYWREAIVEFEKIKEDIIESITIIDLSTLEIPKSFLDREKYKRDKKKEEFARRQKEKGDVIVKVNVPMEKFSPDYNFKQVTATWKISEIPDQRKLIVYGHDGDRKILDKLHLIGGARVDTITMSHKELKHIKDLNFHNLISLEEFMKGNNIAFKRLITAHLIYELSHKYNYLFNRSEEFSSVSKSISKELKSLSAYHSANRRTGSADLYSAMLEVAEENKMFDHSIYGSYLRMKKLLERYEFINVIVHNMNYSDFTDPTKSPLGRALIDLFKYNKLRLNIEHYKLKKEEEVEIINEIFEEETLNDDLIEELERGIL